MRMIGNRGNLHGVEDLSSSTVRQRRLKPLLQSGERRLKPLLHSRGFITPETLRILGFFLLGLLTFYLAANSLKAANTPGTCRLDLRDCQTCQYSQTCLGADPLELQTADGREKP